MQRLLVIFLSILCGLLGVTQAWLQPGDSSSNCSDPGGVNGISQDCYKQINVNKRLVDFAVNHMSSCKPQTPFAQCFLQTLDMGMNDCTGITSGTCPPPNWQDFKTRKIPVEDFYIAYNIYAVWSFFNSYYSAIGNARSAATDSVAAIVAFLDPPTEQNTDLNGWMTALAAGLAFIAVSPGSRFLFPLIIAAQNSPYVVKFLMPMQSQDSRVTQFSQIQNNVGLITNWLQGNVSEALSTTQANASIFMKMTGDAAFTINPLPTIPQQSDALLLGLNTFVSSQALQANGWHIARAVDTDMNGLAANGSKINWEIPGCGTGYDSNMMCGDYYWNQTGMTSFTLINGNDVWKDPQPVMQTLFSNWTTPQLLFDSANQCASPNNMPTLSEDTSGVTTSCLSDMKVCTWDVNPDHWGTEYQYTDCPSDKGFAVNGCRNCPRAEQCFNLPPAYVGPYLLNPQGAKRGYEYCTSDNGHFIQRHSTP